MKLSTSLVAVRRITSSVPRSHFSETDLEKAAKLILEAEGIINPIVLRRVDIQSYEVVQGDFEYYAAVKAREMNPRKGEMIGSFILEPDNEKAILEQVNLLRKSDSSVAESQTVLRENTENVIPPSIQETPQVNFPISDLLTEIEKMLEGMIERKMIPILESFRSEIHTVSSVEESRDKDYDRMTVSELKVIAKKRGIPLSASGKKKKRADLIKELKETDIQK
ncbi:MAG: hypothetical protein ACOC04_00565 [Halothece sp.]